MVFSKVGLTEVIEHLYFYQHLCIISADVFQMPCLRKYPNRCTKGSLRSSFVQRAAAAPQLHKVLPSVALRTTAALQNSEKKSSLRSIRFRNFAKPQRVSGHCKATQKLMTNRNNEYNKGRHIFSKN